MVLFFSALCCTCNWELGDFAFFWWGWVFWWGCFFFEGAPADGIGGHSRRPHPQPLSLRRGEWWNGANGFDGRLLLKGMPYGQLGSDVSMMQKDCFAGRWPLSTQYGNFSGKARGTAEEGGGNGIRDECRWAMKKGTLVEVPFTIGWQ